MKDKRFYWIRIWALGLQTSQFDNNETNTLKKIFHLIFI